VGLLGIVLLSPLDAWIFFALPLDGGRRRDWVNTLGVSVGVA
jgi:hypothetical protein